jgi:DNA-binding response OmpR family regulator
MSAALIVAEPETETRGFLERQLTDDGFDVLGASHPGEVFDLAERARPDLVLVAELELCTRLRDGEPGRSWNRDVPVILLGREAAGAVDRVRALERGADDYVDRPFAYEELRARIRAVLRRVAPRPGDVLEAGEIRIDRPTRCVQVAGRRLLLPAKEFELLAKLAEHPTRVYEKEELLREVWGFRSIGST